MTKVIDCIPPIDIFEQQCVVLKVMLQSLRLKYHMKTIGINKQVSNRDSCEQFFLNNLKYIYQHSGKWDDQHEFKVIPEVNMVSTTK